MPNEDLKNKSKNFLERFSQDYEFGYHGSSKASHKLLWGCFIFLIVALVWSYFASIDEVTVAPGKVIPSKQIQLIQNLEGGIIKEILVHPGQIVEKGDILAYLDDTRFASDYNSAKQKGIALKIRIARLTAQANNQSLVFPQELQQAQPELAANEMLLYQTQMNQIATLKERQGLIKKEMEMTAPLIKEGAVSKVDLLHLQQDMDEISSQILTHNSITLDDLSKAKAELVTLEQDMLAMQDRLSRTTVRSPIKGVINQVYVNTVGGVIKPGDNLIDIVPLDDTLLIEAKVRPSDIGFIHIGQEATVKITAYDYSIYGGLNGVVEQISADTIKDEKGEHFYQIKVRTKHNYIQSKDKPLYIIPGMTATVDILTGHKSVLNYVLKPILKAQQSALRER
ncbi:MAG: HlyD family type I secretion periplasmic adaptor subunit [Gammaproteobacteria bacterium]|nr:HlyD family type I secretion periplasmic adaptor subunit [Gammaproteobacteria bacterium]MCW5584105.1 HlyD family type I secretion periplasmic adaptor subunit [Gammaproteobacteria bacterium]